MERNLSSFELFMCVTTVSVLAYLTHSHWTLKETMSKYSGDYMTLKWDVEDMREEMKSKIAEYANEYMQEEADKIDERNSKTIEDHLRQMRTKMIELQTTNIQLMENTKEQNEMRKELATKVKELETKVKYQERLISARQNQQSSTVADSRSQSKRVDDSFAEKSSNNFRTCHGIRSVDPSLPSGMYWIDPDGKGTGEDPIYVYCNMTTGTTSVKHDSESPMNVGHCAGVGCYSRTVTYNATMEQMFWLAKYSTECHQSIRYDCFRAPIEVNNIAYGWWNDKIGSAKYFWSGVHDEDNQHTCQCGIDENCVDPDVKCNCDSMNPVQLFDSGVITDKNLLPITGLNFGRTQLETSSGVHTLGSFECSGQVTTVMPSSCEDLWRMGHTLNGLYSVVGPVHIETVFCDFQKLPDETGFQKWIGFTDVKSTPVFFYVERNDEFHETGVPIPFDNAFLNAGEAMDLSRGIFTATRAGTYFFSLSGIVNFLAGSTGSWGTFEIDLCLNGDKITFDGLRLKLLQGSGSVWPFSLQTVVELHPDDQISLRISDLKQSYLSGVTYFIGWMLEEKLSETFGLPFRDD